MAKNTGMNKIFQNRLLWMALSLVSALIIWLFINSTELATENPVFYGVRVVFTGQDVLKSHSLIVSNVSNPDVTVRLSGPRSEMAKLTSGNITVKIDVSDATGPGDQRITPEISYPNGVNANKIQVLGITPNTIAFKIDNIVSKQVRVMGEFTGTLAPGFIQDGDITYNPEKVTITGPEKLLNTIEYALVTIDQENVSETLTLNSAYVLYDKYNKPAALTDDITFESESVEATLPVAAVKEIPLIVKTIDGGGATESEGDVKISIEPKNIKISGSPEQLESIKSLEIGVIDLASFELTGEWTFPIKINDGIKKLTTARTAVVKAEIIGMDIKTFTSSNITIVSVPAGYKADGLTKSVQVIIRALSDEIGAIDPKNIRIIADLSDIPAGTLGPGAVTINARVVVDGVKKAGAVGAVPINISLTKT